MPTKLTIVCWSHDGRTVCLNVAGQSRWFPVEFTDGPFTDPYATVDGRTFRVGSSFATR